MKVFINGRFLTQTITGVQRSALETVRALDQLLDRQDPVMHGLEFEVLAPPSTPFGGELTRIPVRRVGALRGHPWEQSELAWHSRKGILLSLANAAPLFRRRQCVTIHDASVFAIPQAYSTMFRTWYRIMLPALGRRAERIITVSLFSRGELARYAGIPESKVTVVPHGSQHILAVPPDESILTKNGLGTRPFVLAVSSRSPHKNLPALYEAARHLDPAGFDIVAAGGTNTDVFDMKHRDTSNLVRHLGYVTDAQLRALYTHASCFVFPSLYEGFGLPPLEAMACGCPVVVSRTASLPEVCGDAALYCDPQDPLDIAASIRRVMDDEGLRLTLKCRGLKRAAEFTWERSARALVNSLREAWAA